MGREKEDMGQGQWTAQRVEDLVGGVLREIEEKRRKVLPTNETEKAVNEKEDYEEWRRAVEKTRQYAKRRKAREVTRRRISRGKPGKGKYAGPKSGYTKFPNDVLEALCKHLRGYEDKVLLLLVRKTWGWNKKSDFISLNQFVKELGILKPNVCRALSSLVKRRIVTVNRDKTYAIQMDTSLWRDKPRKRKKE